jgi:peptide/nickel transport system substrate-binding protein
MMAEKPSKLQNLAGQMHKYLFYLCTAILLASCGKVVQSQEDQRIFRMNLPAGLSTLDPAFAGDQASIWMCSQLYAGLVELDTALQVRPLLAHRWELTDSGRTYTFHLRRGVQFHEDPCFGTRKTRPVVAQDFVESYTRLCDPVVAARGAWIFNGKVQGVADFRDGKSKVVSGFSAPDDSTLVIRLDAPFPPFLGILAMTYAVVVPREAVQHYGKDFRAHPVGCGPFRFKSWTPGRSLILLKNPTYFERDSAGTALPYLDAVQVRFIQERLTEFVELRQGRLDFVSDMDKSTRDEVFLPDGSVRPPYGTQFRIQRAPQFNTEFIGILQDTSAPALAGTHAHPLRDRRVRLALNHAIDRAQLVTFILNGKGSPANSGIVPLGMPGFDAVAVPGYAFDPALSARLLAEAGYPGGKGLPVLTLKSNPAYQPVMEFVQKSLERIGVRLAIDNVDGPTLREMATKGELTMWRASWIADYPDPENYLGLLASRNIPPNGPNRMRYSNPAYDARFAQALATTDDSLRTALQHEMERMVLADAPIIPLYYDRILRLISKQVRGLETNALNLLYLKRVRKAS